MFLRIYSCRFLKKVPNEFTDLFLTIWQTIALYVLQHSLSDAAFDGAIMLEFSGASAVVQIEDVMCANAFRTEVRLWEQQPQYGKLERRTYYSG